MIKGEMSARGGSASGGETKVYPTRETFTKCCGLGGKHKKVFIIVGGIILFAIIFLSIASASWKMREVRNGGMYSFSRGQMNSSEKRFYSMPSNSSNGENQFVLPEDALRSGELAIVVSDLETAKKAISDIATKSKGNIYATFISYASNSLKNGSIVVQVPVENFASAFGELKKVGGRVVQEKTQQVPPRYYYPMGIAAEGEATSAAPQQPTSSSDVKPEIAIYPNPAQTQLAQDKGYIRVIFADYGVGAGNFSQNKGGLWVVFGLKLLLLIVLIALLLVMLKRIFRSLREARAAKKTKPTTVHIVRQMPKTRSRVIKIAKTVKRR
ncbi:MAG: hypothetical protein US70_C0007G0023 [Parcubacteria group bacterium GW2011_GWD2_38_11]|nr:MAG: hypothetical protein US70_C0007G0023 [Parcubacteria group bacterium GW2011_GWD2_38_11]